MFQQKGIWDDEMAGFMDQMKTINESLLKDATLYTAAQLQDLLINEIGFSEVIHSTEQPYLGYMYFVVVRK